MKKRLILIFVILIGLIFIVSGCEQYIGQNINIRGGYQIIKNYIEFKGEENVNNINIDDENGIIYHKQIPFFSFILDKNNINSQKIIQNLDNNQGINKITGNIIYRWRSANTNQGIMGRILKFNQNHELISLRFSQGEIFSDIPLIRNGEVVYPNGRYFIFNFTNITEEILEKFPAVERASTLRFRTYYVNDLMPILRLDDEEGDQRITNHFLERLGEWGNDMEYSSRSITLMKSVPDFNHRDEEEFVKWFVVYIQYFDENGDSIIELPKAVGLWSISERYGRIFPHVGGYSGLIGSKWEGDNLVIYENGFEWGDFEEEEIEDEIFENWISYHLPVFEGIRRQSGNRVQPARRLER